METQIKLLELKLNVSGWINSKLDIHKLELVKTMQ